MKYIKSQYSIFDENRELIQEQNGMLFSIYVNTIGLYFSLATGRFLTLDGYCPISDISYSKNLNLNSAKPYDLIVYEQINFDDRGAYDFTEFPNYFDVDVIDQNICFITKNNYIVLGKKIEDLNILLIYQVSKNVYIEKGDDKITAIVVHINEIVV